MEQGWIPSILHDIGRQCFDAGKNRCQIILQLSVTEKATAIGPIYAASIGQFWESGQGDLRNSLGKALKGQTNLLLDILQDRNDFLILKPPADKLQRNWESSKCLWIICY